MNLITLFFLAAFAVAQNIDNLVLAAAYRIKGVLIPSRQNAVIAFASATATAAATTAGWVLGERARLHGWQNAEVAGRGILIMLGVWSLVGYLWKKIFRQLDQAGAPPSPPKEKENVINNLELMVVAVALAVDNLAPSFAFGVTQPGQTYVFIPVLTTLIFFSSILTVGVGQSLGSRGKAFFGYRSLHFLAPEIVFGILILGIGLFDPA
jgi:putative Mn2+ efflux pump MntP